MAGGTTEIDFGAANASPTAPPALFQRSVCVFLSVRLPACAHISVRVCVCARARDGPSVSLSVEVELRSPLSIHYSTPLTLWVLSTVVNSHVS